MWSDNETSEDLLKFDHLSDAVVNLVTNTALLPVTVGVFGDWGSGKSSLLKMVANRLENEKTVVVLSCRFSSKLATHSHQFSHPFALIQPAVLSIWPPILMNLAA